VEREEVQWDWRLRVRAGQQFERLARKAPARLTDQALSQLRTTQSTVHVPADPNEWQELDLESRRFVQLMAGRAIDGKLLLDQVADGRLTIPASLLQDFQGWLANLYSQ